MRPRPPTPWAPRRSARRRPACWRAWRPNGGGGPSGRPKASRPTSRTWCAARSRWSGTSSRATGTSKCARSRCPMATTRWIQRPCWNGSTRIRSWSSRPSASPIPAPTSRWRPWRPRSTSFRLTPAWISTFTWTGPAAPSSPRSARPTWCSTSVSPGSSRSAPRGTSSAWLRWASAGSCGETGRNSPRT